MKKNFVFYALIFAILLISPSVFAQKQIKTLIIDSHFLNNCQSADLLIYTPESDLKRGSYSHYCFSKKQVVKLLKKDPLKTKFFRLTFSILRVEKEKYIPSDPGLQQPIGGFDITNYYCEAISASVFPADQIKTLVIQSKYLSVSQNKDTLIYSPGSDIKSAAYSYYYFSAKHVRRLLLMDPLKEIEFRMQFYILKVEKKRYIPSNKNLSYPHGGFKITNYYCQARKIVR